MREVELLIFLLLAVALLAGVAARLRVAYPVLLVLGGLALGLVPGLPSPRLEPDVVLFLFLPPLLYAAAFTASAYELRANARPIVTLAVGLVVVTVFAVAAVAHLALHVGWVPAFVLGAVLSPTDPLAATTVISRLGAPPRLATILEGESLVNDGTGLTAYKIAVGAAGAAGVSAGGAVLKLVLVSVGGIGIGVLAGWLLGRLRGFTREPAIDVTLSLLTPYAAYVPAEHLGASGVLATVAAGVWIGTRSLDLVEAGTRLRTLTFWDALSFLLNGLLFVLVGLQVPHILHAVPHESLLRLSLQSVCVAVVLMAVRMLWMFTLPELLSVLAPIARVKPAVTDRAERTVAGWSGMRGAVSLAAALAIPLSVPQRELVIFLACGAVVLTLVVPGLTLGPLVRRLGLAQEEELRRADAEARLRLAHAGLERLEERASEDRAPDRVVARLRERYEARLQRLEDRLEKEADGERSIDLEEAGRLQGEMLDAERASLRAMQRERAFPAEVLHELDRELNLEEARLGARTRA